MPHELEYIVKDALIMCDKGTAPASFTPTYNTSVKISGCLVSTKADKLPLVNIPCMGACSMLQGSPCNPTPTDWENTYKVKVKGQETLLYKSELPCSLGGKIKFITSGQVKIPPEEYDKLIEENSTENDSGLSWLDGVEMLPFIGGVVGMVRSATKDPTDWLGFGLSAVSLVADVAGLFSFGAGNGVSATIKAGKLGRVAIKATKVASKVGKASKLGKAGLKVVAKSLAKKVDDIAIKTGNVCVFACFTAGTKVATKDGYKNIEDIRVGDLVWAYNEGTGESDLKPVVSTMQKEIDATIQITLSDETIETTAEHPFYTQSGWKDASDLTANDRIKTKDGNWQQIKASNFLYSKKKVYNFEVKDWHTYFVGLLMLLVHNAKRVCLSLADRIRKYGKRIAYMGSTPRKTSKIGIKVWKRQLKEGTAKLINGKKHFKDPTDGNWYLLSKADMGHKVSAVRWWNQVGYKYGARSKKVRNFMKASKNYRFELYKNNRRAGSILGKTHTYRKPY
ncbi:MAG: DUF4280 domain-containing protein [Tenacibaculum sp.]|nr:DUF4280 domain-containing protein [Tenacibaculum sp.]